MSRKGRPHEWGRLLLVGNRDREDHSIELTVELEDSGVEVRDLCAGIAPNIECFCQRVGADMHLGHLYLVYLFTVDIEFAFAAERVRLDEVKR